MKRIFDFILSCIGLILFAPLMLFIAILINLMMPNGPVIYKQKRIGKGGATFKLYKFRTMINKKHHSSITVLDDSMITPLGKILRKYKLDELPELFNVLKGDMSLVGPRPDVSGYADRLECQERKILDMKPGITGPATLKYANEEKLLSTVADPVKYNDEIIFPDKVRINLDYINNWSLWGDIKIIFKTVFRRNY